MHLVTVRSVQAVHADHQYVLAGAELESAATAVALRSRSPRSGDKRRAGSLCFMGPPLVRAALRGHERRGAGWDVHPRSALPSRV